MELKLKTNQVIFFFSTSLFSAWLFFVLSLREPYIAAIEVDALAMVNILFPSFWLILLLFIGLTFFVFTNKNSPIWLHIILLSEFALMIYYTPFLIGGFSWSPDSLWHGGVADYIPSILSGAKISMTEYAQSYPLSFLITFGAERLLNVDTVTYTLYIFPPVCITAISALGYFFTYRITGKSTAFLALLIALPSLHYIEPHVSPFATGTILLLLSLILLTYRSKKAILFNALAIIALVLTHPISPIFLGIYLVAAIIVMLLQYVQWFTIKQTILRFLKSKWLLLIIFLSVFWIFWTIFEAAPVYLGVKTPVSNVLSLNFIKNLVNSVEWTTKGQGFIYPQISQLSLMIYAVFLLGILTILASSSLGVLKKKKSVYSNYLRIRLALTALGSAIMSYFLFSSSGERFLLGRGLIIFLIMGSIALATYMPSSTKWKMKIKTGIAFVFIIFLVCTFPVIAYSKESYNTFTPLAEDGLLYLSSIDLRNKTVSMTSDQQMAAYADLNDVLNFTGFPPNLKIEKPDIIVLRINSFYFMAMRYDFSFTNNSYTQLRDYLLNSSEYNKVFSNPQFEIYQKV